MQTSLFIYSFTYLFVYLFHLSRTGKKITIQQKSRNSNSDVFRRRLMELKLDRRKVSIHCIVIIIIIIYLLHHREYNIKQQNAKTLKQYDAKMHKRVSAIKIYKYT